jgi:DNA-binding IclR family transcriptional regulator
MSVDIDQLEYGADTAEEAYLVPGLERGLRILREFSRKEPVLGAPEISRRLRIPRTTVFRLLQTLESMGFVERANRDTSFQLGVGVLHLGSGYLKSLPVIKQGLPAIERLRDRIGLTVHLVIRDGTEIVYAARAEGPASRLGSFKVTLGTRLPAHATVHGQVLLGDLDFEELVRLYKEPSLPRFSSHTPSTVEALYERILMTSRQGYGVSESYFESGVSAISAPVRCKTGGIMAVVAATITRSKIDGDVNKSSLVVDVVGTAEEISRVLRYDPFERKVGHSARDLIRTLG